MLRGTRFNVSEKIAMGELISKSSGRPTGLGSWCILLVNKLCTHKQWVVYKRTYIRPYRHHTQLITDQWVNVKRISNLKSHKLNTWVFLTHSLQPHQIFDHTNWCTWCITNLNHWLTHSLKPHQNMVWVFFPSLQTLYNHTKVLTTPNDVKQTWHTLSNHTKLWSHQIDVRVQQTKVNCDHTNIISMFLSEHVITHSFHNSNHTKFLTTPNWCTWCTTNLTHWQTRSLKRHQNMVWVFFPSLQTLYNHNNFLTTPNWCKTNLTHWLTHSLQPHQIVTTPNRCMCVQQTKVHCDHTNIILMFLSDTRHHSFIPQHSITLNVIIGTTSNDTTTSNLTESHHPPWPTFSSTLPTG